MAAGPRSLLAFWIGGASAPPPPAEVGVKSMLAFWMGGAAGGIAIDPPSQVFSGGGRWVVPPDLREGFRRRLLSEDELVLLMAAAITGAGILH